MSSRRNRRRKNSSSSSSEKSSSSSTSSSSGGFYKYRKGEYIKDYLIRKHISDGTFGRVLKVEKKSKSYAMKIVRRGHTESAKSETEILKYLNKKQEKHVVKLNEAFYAHNHYCMVFELLGPSLYDLMRKNPRKGLPIDLIRQVAKQLLTIVAFIHDNNLTHTDLKPENILFRKRHTIKRCGDMYLPEDNRITVIDFGGAMYDDENHDSIINTRQYRAPEVQLECGDWNNLSDVWGIGCIIAEMYKGQLLFQTRKNEFEHIAMIEKTCGYIPSWMARKVEGSLQPYFQLDRTPSHYVWPQKFTTEQSIQKVMNTKPLSEQIQDPLLLDLLTKLLEVDPRKRFSCRQALDHQFFR